MNRHLLGVCAALAIAAPALAPALAQVEPASREPIPVAEDATLDKAMKDAERDRGFEQANTKVSRTALREWTECLALRNQPEVTRLLTTDYSRPAYRSAMTALSRKDHACVSFQGRLRAGGLLFAGELAETMLRIKRTPVAVDLAKAAGGPATPAFSFTDRIAICTVRSVPSDVAALFATSLDSPAEAKALQAVAPVMGMCAKAAEARKPLSVNPAGMRAMLATATFRSIATMKAS